MVYKNKTQNKQTGRYMRYIIMVKQQKSEVSLSMTSLKITLIIKASPRTVVSYVGNVLIQCLMIMVNQS